jgi:hypothetical protein
MAAFVRRPAGERPLLEALSEHPMNVPLSMKPLRRRLEKLHRFGVVAVQDPRDKPPVNR